MNDVCNLTEHSILIRSTPVFYHRKHVYALAKVRSEKTNQELKSQVRERKLFVRFVTSFFPGLYRWFVWTDDSPREERVSLTSSK